MIYFDNASTTKALDSVLDVFLKESTNNYANPSSINSFSMHLDIELTRIKKDILKLFKLKDSEYEVIFTSGATESNNLAIKGYAKHYKNRGKHLISSKIEHESVLNVLKELEDVGYEVTYLDVDKNGEISTSQLKNSIRNDTILVCLMASNNEVGSALNYKEVKDIVEKYPKCSFYSDVAQAIGKIDLDYTKLDMFGFSFHKIHGLKGSGLLIKKKRIALNPIIFGGNQQNGIRSGTIDFPSIKANFVALKDALENIKSNYNHVHELNNYLRNELSHIDEVVLNTEEIQNPFILSISLKTKNSSVVVEALSSKEIYVNSVSACNSKKDEPSHVLLAMGKDENTSRNVIRISYCNENTIDECKVFIKELNDILKSIRS